MLGLFVIYLLGTCGASVATSCDRAPPDSQPADKNYKLSVAGDPDLFLPGELYTGNEKYNGLLLNIGKTLIILVFMF